MVVELALPMLERQTSLCVVHPSAWKSKFAEVRLQEEWFHAARYTGDRYVRWMLVPDWGYPQKHYQGRDVAA